MFLSSLNEDIKDSFDAISILLVFATLLFSIRYPEFIKIIEMDLPLDKPKELLRKRKEIYNSILFRWLPVVIVLFICTYVMSPLAIKAIIHSKFNLFDFDLIRTAFVLAWVFLLLSFLSTIYLLVKAIIKIETSKTSSQ